VVTAGGADLVLLDVMMPKADGIEILQQIRAASAVPVIMLTALGNEADRVLGLRMGADDYVVKPFSPREVAARVRTILRRRSPATSAAPTSEPAPRVFLVDAVRRVILFHDRPLALTPHEFKLLECLLGQPERVFSREQLLDAMGIAADAGYERNIDGHIRDLRAKLRTIDASAEPIQTHRGFGYSYQPSRC
jgi:two-component system catabolic regulation response regulator CreB